MNSDDLRTRLVAARDCGVLHLEIRDRDPALDGSAPRAVADALVAALGLVPAGDRWNALDRAQAAWIVQEILHRDLAYCGELMDPATASAFAEEFLGQFDEEASFFTNSDFATHLVFINQNGFAAGWQPLTEATFDSGVVAVDRRRVGILWVEDED